MIIILNNVQRAAYELIREDARYIYSIVDILYRAKNINSNFICMGLPYLGVFADGAEKWGKKVGIDTAKFNSQEKIFYTLLRQGHKLFEMTYDNYLAKLLEKLLESEKYFCSIRGFWQRIFGYYNVGADLCNGEFCGNTILCSLYLPINILGNENAGNYIRNMSKVAGELAASFGCAELPLYEYDDNITVKYVDFHFYKSSPLKMNNEFGFLLFSILCSINYVVEFIEKCFTEDIPQKFKFAYLQYYYLCNFLKELTLKSGIDFDFNDNLYNRDFRNCLAHYGLGQYLNENEINFADPLKGLTQKAFGEDYFTTKENLYIILRNLTKQIKDTIF